MRPQQPQQGVVPTHPSGIPGVPPGAMAVQLPYPPPGFHPAAHHPHPHAQPHPYAMAMPMAPHGAPHPAYAVHPAAAVAAAAAGYHHHPHHQAAVPAAPPQAGSEPARSQPQGAEGQGQVMAMHHPVMGHHPGHYALAVSGHMQQAMQPGVMISYAAHPRPGGGHIMALPAPVTQHMQPMHSGAMVLAQHVSQPMATSQPMTVGQTGHAQQHQPQQQEQHQPQQQHQASTSGQAHSGQGPSSSQGPSNTVGTDRSNANTGQQQGGEGSVRFEAGTSMCAEDRDHSGQLLMDEDIDLDETLTKLLESDDPAEQAHLMTDAMTLMTGGGSPSDQSTNTGGNLYGDKPNTLLGNGDEPNFEPWHQSFYGVQGELDELDLDFSTTLESVELGGGSSRPMKRAKSMACLAGPLKKVASHDNLLLNVSQPQALRAIRTFLTKSSLPEDQRAAALNVLELLKKDSNGSVDLPDRSASESGLPLPRESHP
eukprot:jgi/Tetstr1/439261/TSEL_027703.t1